MKISLLTIIFISFIFSENVSYKQIEHIIIKECKKYKSREINKHLIRAIIYHESRVPKSEVLFDTKAVSKKNCKGLMQINRVALNHYNNTMIHKRKPTIKWSNIFIPSNNIAVGVWLIDNYLTTSNDLFIALKRYVGGSSYYAKSVISKQKEYRTLATIKF
jgi:soluble lytic murein transglycosylase-like protein